MVNGSFRQKDDSGEKQWLSSNNWKIALEKAGETFLRVAPKGQTPTKGSSSPEAELSWGTQSQEEITKLTNGEAVSPPSLETLKA